MWRVLWHGQYTAGMKREQFDVAGDAPRPGLRALPVHAAMVLAEHAKNASNPMALSADLTALVDGVRRYQEHPFRRSMKPLQTVWQSEQVRLLRCPATGKKGVRPALLIVPSMINGSAILDLLPEKSFVRWLAARGIDAYLLDWGRPALDRGMKDMDAAIMKRLLPAVDFVLDERRGTPFHALGYCMGGTLLAAAAIRADRTLRGAAFLAAPWDFHAGNAALSAHVRMAVPSVLPMIASTGILPAGWIQAAFAATDSDRTVKKFSAFAAMAPDSAQANLFVTVEDWLNDGVDLPDGIGSACLLQWYTENRPAGENWTVDGEPVRLRDFSGSVLIVASPNDRIVPAESTLAMKHSWPEAFILKPRTGHIGMMAGRGAEDHVWTPILEWIRGSA